MKNVTLSADERLIQLARARAERQKTTLNALFREWLKRYVRRDSASDKVTVTGRRSIRAIPSPEHREEG